MKIFFLFKQMELREAKNKNKEKPSQPKLFLEKLGLEKLINIVSNYLSLSCSFKDHELQNRGAISILQRSTAAVLLHGMLVFLLSRTAV